MRRSSSSTMAPSMASSRHSASCSPPTKLRPRPSLRVSAAQAAAGPGNMGAGWGCGKIFRGQTPTATPRLHAHRRWPGAIRPMSSSSSATVSSSNSNTVSAIPTTAGSRTFGSGTRAGFGRLRQLVESLPLDRVQQLKRDVDVYHRHYAVPAGLHVRRECLITLGRRR